MCSFAIRNTSLSDTEGLRQGRERTVTLKGQALCWALSRLSLPTLGSRQYSHQAARQQQATNHPRSQASPAPGRHRTWRPSGPRPLLVAVPAASLSSATTSSVAALRNYLLPVAQRLPHQSHAPPRQREIGGGGVGRPTVLGRLKNYISREAVLRRAASTQARAPCAWRRQRF